MPDWLDNWLNGHWPIFALFVLRTVAAFRNIFRKKEIHAQSQETPFVIIPIKDVTSKIPSPLKVLPKRIDRTFQVKAEPGAYLLLGGAGVGKTREAIDLVERISKLSGSSTVFLANGYITRRAVSIMLFVCDHFPVSSSIYSPPRHIPCNAARLQDVPTALRHRKP
jgi:hypothetical protein